MVYKELLQLLEIGIGQGLIAPQTLHREVIFVGL